MLKLLPEEQAKVLPVLEHNAYWFHPENLLLSMLSDDNQAIRADAIDRLENSTSRSSYYIPVCVGGRGVALRAAIYDRLQDSIKFSIHAKLTILIIQ